MDEKAGSNRRGALLFLTGPGLCCAAAAAVMGLLLPDPSLLLLGGAFAAAALLAAPLWLRLPFRVRGLSSVWGVLAVFCLSCAVLLPPATQRTAGGILIPGRHALLAAGVSLMLASLIAAIAAGPRRP